MEAASAHSMESMPSSMLPPLRLISPSNLRGSKVVAPSSERGRGKVMRRSLDSHGSNFASRNKAAPSDPAPGPQASDMIFSSRLRPSHW
jgi:hypothetical protein